MKDIDYFVNAEQDYISTVPEPQMIWIEEYGEFGYPDEPLDFLRKGCFKKLSTKAISDDGKNGLSGVEWLILYNFLGFISGAFRVDFYYHGVPDIVKEMNIVLDSVITKAPKHRGDKLYRCLVANDKTDFKVGDIYEACHSLTTSIDDFKHPSDLYIITPLDNDKTRAHDLYKFYNHGNEYQVNFERGTKFKVTDIKEFDGRRVFYLSEIL